MGLMRNNIPTVLAASFIAFIWSDAFLVLAVLLWVLSAVLVRSIRRGVIISTERITLKFRRIKASPT